MSAVAFATTIDPTLISANPDTDISLITPGVVLSAPNNPDNQSVYAVPQNVFEPFGREFGQRNVPGGYYDGFDIDSPLKATFTTPIASVSVKFTIESSGFGSLTAFDLNDLQIGSRC